MNYMATSLTQFEATGEASGDRDLVHACKNGDAAAFGQLVKRYDRKLLRIAQSVTHNREDSQDAVQEAFLKAYQHLADFREACQFSTWLIRITVNQALMKLRKQHGASRRCGTADRGRNRSSRRWRSVREWSPAMRPPCRAELPRPRSTDIPATYPRL